MNPKQALICLTCLTAMLLGMVVYVVVHSADGWGIVLGYWIGMISGAGLGVGILCFVIDHARKQGRG